MATESKARTGLLDSFRALGESLLGSLQERIELISIELQEEKLRLVQIFFWISAVVFSCVMAVTFASLALIFYFNENVRFEVLLGLAVFFVGAFAVIALAFSRYLSRQPKPFAGSLQELAEDRPCIRRKN